METKLLLLFIVLNIFNVILQTVKSIITIRCGKTASAIINAVAYGLYTIVTIYLLCDLPLLWKAGIVALCNFVGVWVVKFFEEKARKDKLWKVEATVPKDRLAELSAVLEEYELPYNCLRTTGDYAIFNIFCATQEQSKFAKMALDGHFAKYFVSESKTL